MSSVLLTSCPVLLHKYSNPMKSIQPSVISPALNHRKKEILKIHFTDFGHHFSIIENWLFRILDQQFSLVWDPVNPELIIYNDYGLEHLRYRCHKVYYSCENVKLQPRLSDFSFSIAGSIGRHQYFPNLVENRFFEEIRSECHGPELALLRNTPKTKTFNFVYSNADAEVRIDFCRRLMQYKRVDCPGIVLNNYPAFDSHGYQYEKKMEFLKHYKFTIAFENESAINYTTEKIMHAFAAGSIPIYWGNPKIAELFDSRCFINCHDFETFDEVIAWVKKVDHDEKLFEAYRVNSIIPPNSPLAALSMEFLQLRASEIGRAAKDERSVSEYHLFPFAKWCHFLRWKLRLRMTYYKQRCEDFARNMSTSIASKSRPVSDQSEQQSHESEPGS